MRKGKAGPLDVGAEGAIVLGCALPYLALRSVPFWLGKLPVGWDAYFHMTIAESIAARGRAVHDWLPYEDLPLNYPIGAHRAGIGSVREDDLVGGLEQAGVEIGVFAADQGRVTQPADLVDHGADAQRWQGTARRCLALVALSEQRAYALECAPDTRGSQRATHVDRRDLNLGRA